MSWIDNTNQSAYLYNQCIIQTLREICDPLFKNFGVKSFAYQIYLKDGSFLHLHTDLEWEKFYLQNSGKGLRAQEELKKCPINEYHYFLWPNSKVDPIFRAFYERNIWNGLTIYLRAEHSISSWYFAVGREDKNISGFYLNNIPLFHKFIDYFNEKARDLINYNDSSKLAVFQYGSFSFEAGSNSILDKRQKFLEQIKTENERMMIISQIGKILLSKRETECMRYLSEGLTAKEIGRRLNLSFRTIEAYINNIKLKTGIENRSKLIAAYIETANKIII